MFRWCAYCQSFLGESEPREDFSLTHGICSSCKKQPRHDRDASAAAARPMLEFFHQMRSELLNGRNQNPLAILESARQLGIAPVDLIAGIMQPLLAEIARLQDQGQATILQEHEFSLLLDGILHEINRLNLAHKPKITTSRADVLLSCCDQNYHVFGIRLINELLTKEGMNTVCIFPGYPLPVILRTAEKLNACVIGISVIKKEQTESLVREWASILEANPEKSHPSLIIGGFGASTTLPLPPDLYIHNGSLADFTALVSQLIEKARTPLTIAKRA